MIFAKVTARFEAEHFWKDAPTEVDYLRSPHRHEFHVAVLIEERHDDREIEFIMFKHNLIYFVRKNYEFKVFPKSCAMIAKEIKVWLETVYSGRKISVEISEDGENGEIVVWD